MCNRNGHENVKNICSKCGSDFTLFIAYRRSLMCLAFAFSYVARASQHCVESSRPLCTLARSIPTRHPTARAEMDVRKIGFHLQLLKKSAGKLIEASSWQGKGSNLWQWKSPCLNFEGSSRHIHFIEAAFVRVEKKWREEGKVFMHNLVENSFFFAHIFHIHRRSQIKTTFWIKETSSEHG